jgi:hypothetical protein
MAMDGQDYVLDPLGSSGNIHEVRFMLFLICVSTTTGSYGVTEPKRLACGFKRTFGPYGNVCYFAK